MSSHELLVVVPVHDEEATLGGCLDSITTAVGVVRGVADVRVVVVLDACSDGSAAIAAVHDVEVVTCGARSVGVARALGVATAARDVADDARAWIATTDADSRVGPTWLAEHLAAAEAGHEAWLGRVRPDPADLLPHVVRDWHRRHRGPGHVHGANLGVRLSAYRASGGFRPLAVGEDVALVDALRAGGASIGAGGRPVVTSGRTRGRAPDGFAAHLWELSFGSRPARLTT